MVIFPGAQGFGTDTPAGRGGQIIRVTTLEDGYMTGTLRHALETVSGPRVAVFEVGGVLWLQSDLNIRNPFLTIAGQTAPSPGITVAGRGVKIRTHDVLMQHVACRGAPDNGLAFVGSSNGVYNVVVDHCSISWAINKNMNTWFANVHDITISNCIISESLKYLSSPHHMGFLVGDHAQRITIIGNLLAHNSRRNPGLFGDTSSLVVNNVIYNAVDHSIHFSDANGSGPLMATVVGNVIVPGPNSPNDGPPITVTYNIHAGSLIYLNDNQAPAEPVINESGFGFTGTPPVWIGDLNIRASSETADWVLAHAGARPWDRDAVDERIVSDVENITGGIVDSVEEAGGWLDAGPTYRSLDLPDNPNDDDDEDGYTNLEEWVWTFENGGSIMSAIEDLRAEATSLRAAADRIDIIADALVTTDLAAQVAVTEAQEALAAVQAVEVAL